MLYRWAVCFVSVWGCPCNIRGCSPGYVSRWSPAYCIRHPISPSLSEEKVHHYMAQLGRESFRAFMEMIFNLPAPRSSEASRCLCLEDLSTALSRRPRLRAWRTRTVQSGGFSGPGARPDAGRGVGGRREDQEHPRREPHRRPRLPQFRRRLPATDGRPHRPRAAQAGGANPSLGWRISASTKPSPSSIRRSTGGRHGETPRESSGDDKGLGVVAQRPVLGEREAQDSPQRKGWA